MKRTIVALAALGMLATAGSVRAEQFKNADLSSTYVEVFQGPTTGAPVAGYCALSFDGFSKVVSPSACLIVNGSGVCVQGVSGTYNINTDGSGSIAGTLGSGGGGCPSTAFAARLQVQELSYTPQGPVAENVLLVSTTAGLVESGNLVPQTGGPFNVFSLNGLYTELISGTAGGNSYAGICSDSFNGFGSVTGTCTINTATIGPCTFNLTGNYGVTSIGSAFVCSPGTTPGSCSTTNTNLIPVAGSPVACVAQHFDEFLRIVNGTYSTGPFTAGQIDSIRNSLVDPGVIGAGSYLPIN